MRPPPQGLWAGPPPRVGDLPGIPNSHSKGPCPRRLGTGLGVSTSARLLVLGSGPGAKHRPLARTPKEEGPVSRR